MKGSLHQADAGGASLGCAIQDGLHELAAGSKILRGGVDADGADAVNDRTLIEDIAADDPAVVFRHYAIQAGAGEHPGEQTCASLGSGKIAGKVVSRIDGGKGLVADVATDGRVLGRGDTHHDTGSETSSDVSSSTGMDIRRHNYEPPLSSFEEWRPWPAL